MCCYSLSCFSLTQKRTKKKSAIKQEKEPFIAERESRHRKIEPYSIFSQAFVYSKIGLIFLSLVWTKRKQKSNMRRIERYFTIFFLQIQLNISRKRKYKRLIRNCTYQDHLRLSCPIF